MDANVETQIETAKLNERQQSLLNLANDFKRSAALLLGTESIWIDFSITVPEGKYQSWMKDSIKDELVWIGIGDDTLPF